MRKRTTADVTNNLTVFPLILTILTCHLFFIGAHCYFEHAEVDEEEIPEEEWFKEKRLVKQLLTKHPTHSIGRPVDNHWEPIVVEFGINLIQVLAVNESAGQLVTNIWTHYRWRDPSLTWNQTALGIDKVRVPSEEIWLPDVELFNYADTRIKLHRSTLAVVNASGNLDWIPSGIFRSACEIDTFAFPFDEQVCSMSFRSLSMGITLLKLDFVEARESMSLDSYVPNPEWEIIENRAVRSIKIGKRGMKTSFYDLTFTLRLKRRSVFHRYVLVLPCVLLSLTAGVLFLLPPESPAKIQIGIFIFQGFFLLLNLLLSSTPPASSRNPTIGLYYSASMISTTVVMFACGFLVELHFRADHRAPMTSHMRNVVIKLLASWLLIPIPDKSPRQLKRKQLQARATMIQLQRQLLAVKMQSGSETAGPSVSSSPTRLGVEKVRMLVESRRNSAVVTTISNPTAAPPLKTWSSSRSLVRNRLGSSSNNNDEEERENKKETAMLSDLVELRMSLQRRAEDQAVKEYNHLIQTEWIIAAMVFDRVFFLIYVGWIIISLWMLLPQEERFN